MSLLSNRKIERRPFVPVILTLGTVTLAAMFTSLLAPLQRTPSIAFFAAVTLSGWYGGWRQAVLGGILSALAIDFFFVEPTFTLLSEVADLVRLGAFLMAALVIGWLQEVYKRAAQELWRKTSLLQLLESVAAAANEARTVEEAMETGLGRICAHLDWPMGHAYLPAGSAAHHFWYLKNSTFEPFRGATLALAKPRETGLIGRVMASRRPVWLPNVLEDGNFSQTAAAQSLSIQSAFAFPVMLGNEVAAVLEFFSTEMTGRDEPFLTILGNIGNQLGRVIERARVQMTLQASETRFRSVAQSANEAIITADSGGNILFWNRAAQAIFGYEEMEVSGKPLTILMPERYRHAHLAALATFRGDAHVMGRSLEVHGLHKDGREFPLEVSLARWNVGGSTFFSGIARDITARKQAEDALRESEEHFRVLVEGIKEYAIFRLDPQGRVVSWSKSAERIEGYKAGQILGRDFACLFPSADIEAAKPEHLLKEAAAEGRIESEGWHVRKDGGWFWANAILSALHDPQGKLVGFALIVRDITSRKRADESLRRAHDELEARVRERTGDLARINESLEQEIKVRKLAEEQINESLHEKEVLLREIHHRVKNNLQIISSLLSIQSRHIRDPHALEMFKESQNRVKSIATIHQKLFRSRDLTHIRVAEYVRELVGNLFRSYDVKPGLITARIDVDDVALGIDTLIPCALIINELVTNSLKYAFPDGAHGEVRVEVHEEDGHFQLAVGDNGVGLPAGRGLDNPESLGLQIVSALTDQLGGTMEMTSGDGTTCKISFDGSPDIERKTNHGQYANTCS